MLRMQAKREGLYKKDAAVTEEDEPESASAKYTEWRNRKIRECFAKSIDTHATDHSTIMTNPAHAQEALAYDVAVGVCRITEKDMRRLRVEADWRLIENEETDPSKIGFYKYFKLGLINGKSPLEWAADKDSPGQLPQKIINKR